MIANGQEFDGTAPSVYKKKNPTDKAAVDVDDERKAFLSEMHVHIRETNSNLAVYNLENMRQTLGDLLRKRLHDADEDKYDDMKDQEKPPKRMKRQSNRIKEIRNNIMYKQADIQEFQKKMMATPAAPPGTEGTSASDSAERAADGIGGSSPPAEEDSDYYDSADDDLLLVELAA